MPSRNTLAHRPTGQLRQDIEALWDAVRALQIIDSPDIIASTGSAGTALRLRQQAPAAGATTSEEDAGVWV